MSFFCPKSEILYEVMNSLGNIVVDADLEEGDEAETSKYLRFCLVILRTTILIADRIFDHCVNDCIYLDILKKKILSLEQGINTKYNEKHSSGINKGNFSSRLHRNVQKVPH